MKKNKILAGISALVMGATMMAGTAMSASAADVYTDPDDTTTYVGDGGFYAYYYGTDDGVTYTLDWHKAPHGMYGDFIDGDVIDNGDGTVTFNTGIVTLMGTEGYIYQLMMNGANAISDTDNDGYPETVTMYKDTVYTLGVMSTNGTLDDTSDDTAFHTTYQVKFIVSSN